MLTIKINAVQLGFTRFFSEQDTVSALEFVASKMEATVVCLDTPASPAFVQFVQQLHVADRHVIVRDHHDIAGEPKSPRDEEIRASVNAVRTLLGEDAVVSNRTKNPACSSLIEAGEFMGDDFILICDADADGFTAGCKALGLTYPELDYDAALLDGPPTRRQGLSQFGELLNKGIATLPPFNDRCYGVEAIQLFEAWAKAVSGDMVAHEFLTHKVKKFDGMVDKAHLLAGKATEVVPGVWLADLVGERDYHMATLAASLEARQGCRITVIRKDDGPIAKIGGVQYSLSRHTADKDTDMKSLFPSGFTSSPETGMIGNVPFLIHTSGKVWEEILLPALKDRFGS